MSWRRRSLKRLSRHREWEACWPAHWESRRPGRTPSRPFVDAATRLRLERAISLRAAGDLKGALSVLNAAIRLRSDIPWPYAWRAEIHHRRGHWRRSLRDLDRALALDPRCDWLYVWKARLASPESAEVTADLMPYPFNVVEFS